MGIERVKSTGRVFYAGAMAFGPLDEGDLQQVQDIIAEFEEDQK